jgi:hypothetical protein
VEAERHEEELRETAMLEFVNHKPTEAEIAHYNEHGFALCPLLAGAPLKAVQTEADRLWALANKQYDAAQSWNANAIINGVHKDSVVMRELIYRSPLVDLMTRLIGPNVKAASNQLVFKHAGDNNPYHWHQDNGFGPLDIVPLLTPLRPDQSLDEAGLERLIEHALAGGVSGVFLLGSTGEFALLDHETRFQLIRAARRVVRGRVPVLAGVSEPGTRAAIEFGRRAVELGAEAVVASPPFYYHHSQGDLIAHFTAIAEGIPAPLVLYNIPRNVKVSLAPETVRRLMEIPNIIGLKDSAGDMAMFRPELPGLGIALTEDVMKKYAYIPGPANPGNFK